MKADPAFGIAKPGRLSSGTTQDLSNMTAGIQARTSPQVISITVPVKCRLNLLGACVDVAVPPAASPQQDYFNLKEEADRRTRTTTGYRKLTIQLDVEWVLNLTQCN